jgi:hypothetical protein
MLIKAFQRCVKDCFSAIYFQGSIVHEGLNSGYLPGEYTIMAVTIVCQEKIAGSLKIEDDLYFL